MATQVSMIPLLEPILNSIRWLTSKIVNIESTLFYLDDRIFQLEQHHAVHHRRLEFEVVQNVYIPPGSTHAAYHSFGRNVVMYKIVDSANPGIILTPTSAQENYGYIDISLGNHSGPVDICIVGFVC